MVTITPEELAARLPETDRPLSKEQLQLLINDSLTAIKLAFWQRGRSLENELSAEPMLAEAVKIVVFELVGKHVASVGRKGLRAVSSGTGGITDRWEFIEQQQSGWATVMLSNDLLDLLRLRLALPIGNFPPIPAWPERGCL